MKILVINSGSSSVKFTLFDSEVVLANGIAERIGQDNSSYTFFIGENKEQSSQDMSTHDSAISFILDYLIKKEIISSYNDIEAVGHRVVHGGNEFKAPVIITDEVKASIKNFIPLAPLHNPHNLAGITAVSALMDVKQVAVFDTAFHQSMPKNSFIYPIPYSLYKDDGIQKFGFHGISHEYLSLKVSEMDDAPEKIITLHLGNGCSAAAIKNGKSLDTTMGFTPLEGLMMGTRSGSIDPAIISYLIKNKNMSIEDVDNILNNKSGLLGVSGISHDLRDLKDSDDELAKLAIDLFCYKVAKTIASYWAVLDGCNAIVFSAGIGENVSMVREKICSYLGSLGVMIDLEANKIHAQTISSPESKVKVFVIPTNEELMIAKHVTSLL